MRSTAIFLIATGLAGSAAWWTLRTPAEKPAPAAAENPVAAKSRPKLQKKPVKQEAPAPSLEAERPEEHGTDISTVEIYESPPAPSVAGRPAAPVTEQELTARAAKVEREATRELQRLVKILDLTQEQQDRVFEKLVRNSTSWMPGMTVSGSSGASGAPPEARSRGDSTEPGTQVTVGGGTDTTAPRDAARIDKIEAGSDVTGKPTIDAISDELTLDQQIALLTDESDRQQWWSEVLTNIQEDMDKETTGTVVKESTGPDVLE